MKGANSKAKPSLLANRQPPLLTNPQIHPLLLEPGPCYVIHTDGEVGITFIFSCQAAGFRSQVEGDKEGGELWWNPSSGGLLLGKALESLGLITLWENPGSSQERDT